MWCVAELDGAYIQHMEDVLAVYEKPYDPAEPVVCIDEKPVALHADVRPPSPARPGKPAKQDNEYERCGTANIFGAVEPKTGRHFTTATPDRSGAEFARLLGRIVEHYPEAQTIHVVMDNLNIHTRKSLVNYFGEEEGGSLWDRLTVHYTPKHGSWLNQAEIELSLVSRRWRHFGRRPANARIANPLESGLCGGEFVSRRREAFYSETAFWPSYA